MAKMIVFRQLKPGADDRNDIVFVSFLLRFCFVLETFYNRFPIVSTYERVNR